MTVEITRVLRHAEYQAMQEEALAKGWWRNDRRMFLPGMAWYEPWIFDPTGEAERAGLHVMIKSRPAYPGNSFLSVHYWRDWADKRPPICVVCPNGDLWEIDRKSSNGDGWRVTGDLPRITCAPSIKTEGYHGHLRNGRFTADVDRPDAPNGVARPIVDRLPP